MTRRICTTDPLNGCTTCPAVPEQPFVEGGIQYAPSIGWNAGANSVSEIDGDLHTVFRPSAGTVGAVVGLRRLSGGRGQQIDPARVDFGLYFQNPGSVDLVSVIERGVERTVGVLRDSGDMFEIRRVDGIVTYWQGTTLLYQSQLLSTGILIVTACLFATGDTIL